MTSRKQKILKYKRARKFKTDYRKRLTQLKSGQPRFIIRRSLKNVIVQAINYDPNGDKVVIAVSSQQLKKYGLKVKSNNLPISYLTGYLAGKRALSKGIKKGILDIGFFKSTKGSKLYSALKGIIDSGVEIPFSEEILPSDDRITGKQIEIYAKKLKEESGESFNKKFSRLLKENVDPMTISSHYDSIKSKIKSE